MLVSNGQCQPKNCSSPPLKTLERHGCYILMLAHTAEGACAGLLNQRRFTLKDLQSLLESRNFRLTTCLLLRVWLSLGNTHLLQLVQARVDSRQLIRDRCKVRGQL